MAKLTYMPTVHDADETVVDGVKFPAYEAVEVDDKKHELIAKLKRNPWFTDGEPSAERKEKWASARKAQAQAKEHRAEADKLEAEHK